MEIVLAVEACAVYSQVAEDINLKLEVLPGTLQRTSIWPSFVYWVISEVEYSWEVVIWCRAISGESIVCRFTCRNCMRTKILTTSTIDASFVSVAINHRNENTRYNLIAIGSYPITSKHVTGKRIAFSYGKVL